MCPTSNKRLSNVSSSQNHPILALDEASVKGTVNSDQPTWFGVNLTQEMQPLVSDRQVSWDGLARWMRNAFEVAIADDASAIAIFNRTRNRAGNSLPRIRISGSQTLKY